MWSDELIRWIGGRRCYVKMKSEGCGDLQGSYPLGKAWRGCLFRFFSSFVERERDLDKNKPFLNFKFDR